jgi:hypothetical protein
VELPARWYMPTMRKDGGTLQTAPDPADEAPMDAASAPSPMLSVMVRMSQGAADLVASAAWNGPVRRLGVGPRRRSLRQKPPLGPLEWAPCSSFGL